MVLHLVVFFDQVNCADNRVERGANRVDLSTTESILITIESVFSIESVYHNRVGFCHNRVHSCRNRVDSCRNRVDSGAAHNTIFGSTILKQTAFHNNRLECLVTGHLVHPCTPSHWETSSALQTSKVHHLCYFFFTVEHHRSAYHTKQPFTDFSEGHMRSRIKGV